MCGGGVYTNNKSRTPILLTFFFLKGHAPACALSRSRGVGFEGTINAITCICLINSILYILPIFLWNDQLRLKNFSGFSNRNGDPICHAAIQFTRGLFRKFVSNIFTNSSFGNSLSGCQSEQNIITWIFFTKCCLPAYSIVQPSILPRFSGIIAAVKNCNTCS